MIYDLRSINLSELLLAKSQSIVEKLLPARLTV